MSGGIPRLASSAKNRSDGKPCSIRALANEMNQVKGRVTIAADNHVTHNVTRPRIRRRPGSRELLAIVLETWAFNSRCIFGELQVEDHIAGAIHDAHALLSQCLEDSFTGWRHSVCSPYGFCPAQPSLSLWGPGAIAPREEVPQKGVRVYNRPTTWKMQFSGG